MKAQVAKQHAVMTDESGLAVNDITVTYRNGHTALKNTTFEIPRGTITALVGVNGSGKSTLFKAVMGFVPLAQGEVTIFGYEQVGSFAKKPCRLRTTK